MAFLEGSVAGVSGRVPWVDRLRGWAVLGMFVYHFAYDLNYLEVHRIPVFGGSWGWEFLAQLIRVTFLTLVGVSLALSLQRPQGFVRRTWRRAAMVLVCGMLVTAGTYAFFPDAYIRFGILHLIAAALFLAAPLAGRPVSSAAAGFLVLALTPAVTRLAPLHSFFIPLGAPPPGFYTFDYFPLFPWLLLPFFGVSLGHALKWAGFLKPAAPKRPDVPGWLGRHALILYLVHQPVFIGLLLLWRAF